MPIQCIIKSVHKPIITVHDRRSPLSTGAAARTYKRIRNKFWTCWPKRRYGIYSLSSKMQRRTFEWKMPTNCREERKVIDRLIGVCHSSGSSIFIDINRFQDLGVLHDKPPYWLLDFLSPFLLFSSCTFLIYALERNGRKICTQIAETMTG